MASAGSCAATRPEAADQSPRSTSGAGAPDASRAARHPRSRKEELFTAILEKRDEQDRIVSDEGDPTALREAFLTLLQHNSAVPGLVELFSRLAVDAADPTHPAHDFFLERTRRLSDSIAELSRIPGYSSPLPADVLARVIQALADGLQLQWLRDPSVDMAGTMAAALEVLTIAGDDEDHP